MTDPITVEATIEADRDKVWEMYHDPEAIKEWNAASDDWHTTDAKNDVITGGTFDYRMEAKDGSIGFNLKGTYDEVVEPEYEMFVLEDGRKVSVSLENVEEGTHVVVRFEPEHENSREMQAAGWQATLDNFKKYVESV